MYIYYLAISHNHDFFSVIIRGLIWQKYHHNFFNDFIMILCYVGFTILFEHYSQTNFPYYKDKSFKREQNIKNNGENNGGYLGQSGRS